MSKLQLKASLALWRAKYAFRQRRLKYWQQRKETKGIVKWTKLSEEAKAKIHQRLKELGLEKPKPAPPQPHNVTMYDSVDANQIPPNPEAVAGYTAGHWPNYNEMLKKFPKAHHVSIAIAKGYDALCLDVESGDASPSDAPAWVRRQHARGVRRPILYASLSVMPEVQVALTKDSIKRHEYRLWSAHYTYQAHIDPGMDATQWTDKALGRNLDESLCSPSFFA